MYVKILSVGIPDLSKTAQRQPHISAGRLAGATGISFGHKLPYNINITGIALSAKCLNSLPEIYGNFISKI